MNETFTITVNGVDYEIRPMVVEDEQYNDRIVLFYTDLPFEENYQFEITMAESDYKQFAGEMEYRENGEKCSTIASLLIWDEINSFFETDQSE